VRAWPAAVVVGDVHQAGRISDLQQRDVQVEVRHNFMGVTILVVLGNCFHSFLLVIDRRDTALAAANRFPEY
jgi:hypothetical protein